MTKKQLKQLAKKMASLESIIQTGTDKNEVERAKNEMIKLQESADLEVEEMVQLDTLIQTYLNPNLFD